MNIGIIGTGRHGSRYAHHVVNDFDDMQLSAIARRSDEGREQASGWGALHYRDYAELIASARVDAVIAAVPPVHNRDIAHRCSREGKPLLLEKPLAVSSSEGQEIVALMQQTGTPLTVGQTLRYKPVVESLRAELPGQGRLHTFYANQRLEPSTLQWLDNPGEAGWGITFHIAVHVFDALHYITGLRVERVRAVCRVCRTENLEDLALVQVEMEGGVFGVVDVSKLSASRSGRYEFVCENSQLHGDQIHGYVDRVVKANRRNLAQFDAVPTIPLLLEQWRAFLHGEGKNPVPGEDGLRAIRASEACLLSSAENRWVDVPAD